MVTVWGREPQGRGGIARKCDAFQNRFGDRPKRHSVAGVLTIARKCCSRIDFHGDEALL